MTIDDHLDLFVAANMPSIGADTQPSPLAHLCDGAVDLCVARACSRTVGVQVRLDAYLFAFLNLLQHIFF